MPKKAHKKGRVSEQEQLATKLDKALSLTKLGKFNKSSCRFTDTSSSGKSRASGGSGGGSGSKRPALSDADARAGRPGKSGLSKDLSSAFVHKSKGGKSKTAGKTKTPQPSFKGRSQRKVSYSPARSELSSFSNSKYGNDYDHNHHLLGRFLKLRPHVQILASSD